MSEKKHLKAIENDQVEFLSDSKVQKRKRERTFQDQCYYELNVVAFKRSFNNLCSNYYDKEPNLIA